MKFTVEEMSLIQAMNHTCRRMLICHLRTSLPNIEDRELQELCEKTLKKSKSAAVKVDKLIAKLPADVNAEFTAKDEKAIDAAWKAYDKLTDEQKTFLEDEQHLLDCYNKAYPEG